MSWAHASTDPSPATAIELRPSRPVLFYLASALLVLLGGYLRVHDQSGRLVNVALRDVFATALVYQLAVLGAFAWLHGRRGDSQDCQALLAILALFILDAPMIQHLYGWDVGDGRTVAVLGAVSGIVYLRAATRILCMPVASRTFCAVASCILFYRFGPTLLLDASGPLLVTARHVLLGWILALAVTLPMLLPASESRRSRLPSRRIEQAALAGSATFAILHFVAAGTGFGLAFRIVYLAPLAVMLAPALERVIGPERLRGPMRLAVEALPYLGVAIAATGFSPALLEADWARTFALGPFYPVLLLAAAVQLARGLRSRRWPLVQAAAVMAALACLGGDLPEAIVNARFPTLMQVLACSTLLWAPILLGRDRDSGMVGHGLASFVIAGALAEHGCPWPLAWLVALLCGVLVLESLGKTLLEPLPRLLCVIALVVVPLGLLAADSDVPARRLLCAASLALVGGLGLLRRDRLLLNVTGAGAGLLAIVLPIALQRRHEVATGTLLAELGFVLLLVGLLDAHHGQSVRARWQSVWRQERAEVSAEPGQ